MPVGTVRGRFELDAPALQTLRDLEKQGIKTQAEMKALGEEMDRVGGQKDVAQIKEYDKAVKDMGGDSERIHREMRTQWAETTAVVRREVASQKKEIDGLIARLEELNAIDATPNINIDGLTQARAELAAFKRELASVDRTHATATLGARPSAVGSAMGGMGGGGGGGGLGGGGGGAYRRRGPVDFGMSGLRPRSLLIGAGVAYARPLIGAGAALGSSAGSAALGGGALAATGYGAALTGGLLTYATAKPMMEQLKNVQAAEKQYTQQVALHGATSTQAAAAQDKLNLALSQAPAHTRAFVTELTNLRTEWMKASAPAQANLFGAGRGFLGGIRQGIPSFARSATVATAAVQREATSFGQFLGGPRGQRTASIGANIFADNLPYVRRDLQAIFTMWSNLMQASSPFFRDANRSVTQFLEGSAKSSNNIGNLRKHIRTMISDFKEWVRLGQAIWRLIRDIGGLGRGSGTSLVKDLTAQLNTWDKWINRNPARVQSFFSRSIQSVKDLARALGQITGELWKLLGALQPTLDGISGLMALTGGSGILSSPTALLAGYAAFRGISRGGRGGGARGGGGGGGFGFGMTGTTAAEIAALGGGGSLAGQRIFGAGFRGGAPASQIGRGRILGSRLLGRGVGFVGPRLGPAAAAGARAYLPIATLLAIGTASQPGFGTFSDRVSAFGAGLDPTGLSPMPETIPQATDSGSSAASEWFKQHPHANIRQMRGALASLVGAGRQKGTTGLAGAVGSIGPIGALENLAGRQTGGYGDIAGLQKAAAAGDKTAAHRLAQYQAINDVLKRQVALQKQAAADVQTKKAARDIVDLGKAFDTLNKHLGRKEAIKSWESDFNRMFAKLGPVGKRALARGGAQWVEEMRRAGQLTNKQAKAMDDGIAARLQSIIGSFEKTGRRIEVINGQIYDGSHKKWQEIQNAMGTASEQALERVKDAFTKIQWYAIHTLESMGVGTAAAKRIVSMQDPQSSKSNQRAGKFATANAGSPLSAGPYGQQRKVRERGGRLSAPGNTYDLSDRLMLPNGDMAAHNELMVNQHTERRVNKLLAEKNTTLGREVAFEGRPHSKPGFARGGRRGVGAGVGVGAAISAGVNAATQQSIGGAHPAVSQAVRLIMSANPGLSVTSTTGGGHAAGSFHYKGEAIDIAGAPQTMFKASDWVKRTGLYRQLAEGIHNPNLAVKYGQLFPGAGPFGGVWGNHRSHIHIAVLDNTQISGSGMAGGGGGGFSPISIPAPHSNLRGAPGAVANRAGSTLARGMQEKVNKQLAKMGGGGGGIPGASGPWLQALRQIAAAKGWNAADWEWIVQHESAGNPNSVNPSSGAFGLGQFLGATKAAYAKYGATSRDPAQQINAMAHYIADRYGNPTSAKAFWLAHHWYELGGRRPNEPFGRDKDTFAGFMRHGGSFETMPGRAAHFVAGEGGVKEEVHVRPVRPARVPALKGLKGAFGGLHLHVHGDVHANDPAQVEEFLRKVEERVGKKLFDLLGDDKTADLELIDG